MNGKAIGLPTCTAFPFKGGILVFELFNSVSDLKVIINYFILMTIKSMPDGYILPKDWTVIALCCKDGFRKKKETEDTIINYCINNNIRQINFVSEIKDFERYLINKPPSFKYINKVIIDFLISQPEYFYYWHDDDIVGTNPRIWENIIDFLSEYKAEMNLDSDTNMLKSLAEDRMVYINIAGMAGTIITGALTEFMKTYKLQ